MKGNDMTGLSRTASTFPPPVMEARRWLDGVAGGLFVAFGVKLALTEAPGAR